MTKRELIDELKIYPDDALIDVHVDDSCDRLISGIAEVTTEGGTMWVTLGVH